MLTKPRATVTDLYNVQEQGKAELVNGELVLMSPTRSKPSRAAGKVFTSLTLHEETVGGGYAFNDNTGFLVNLPDRQSFSPDAAWYVGDIDKMGFLQGAPRFAVEVRSENDYGPSEDLAIAKKITDYFAAGTLVVWDVDLLSGNVVRVYRASDPKHPTIYRRGQNAEAEPAVPGWTMPVDRLFA